MPKLNVVLRDGRNIVLPGRFGLSLMQHIRDAGVSELQAACGGECCCATCHVYVFPQQLGETVAMSADEDALLGFSQHRRANSRLACQIRFAEELDGITVAIAPEG